MKKLSDLIGKYMAVIVLAVAALALLVPGSCLWIRTGWINYLLMIVMFGMGLTMKLSDFSAVFARPGNVIVGCAAQFLVMPALTYLLLRTSVHVDVLAMFFSIIQVVILPIGLGILINRFFGNFTKKAKDALPLLSVTAICLIIAAVVSHNSEKILSTGAIIFAIVILHNLLGYLCGFVIGILFKMDLPRRKAVAIEIGMQNSGLSTTLAASAFPDLAMATVPGAVFSVWHNISGAILAGIFRRMDQPGADQ